MPERKLNNKTYNDNFCLLFADDAIISFGGARTPESLGRRELGDLPPELPEADNQRIVEAFAEAVKTGTVDAFLVEYVKQHGLPPELVRVMETERKQSYRRSRSPEQEAEQRARETAKRRERRHAAKQANL